MADWIAFTHKIMEEALIIPDKVRAGALVRESLPLKEHNSQKEIALKQKCQYILKEY